VSRETTEARSIARAAHADWKSHIRSCPACTAAARSRHWAELCGPGGELHKDHRAAAESLAKNRALDKLPSPDQESML